MLTEKESLISCQSSQNVLWWSTTGKESAEAVRVSDASWAPTFGGFSGLGQLGEDPMPDPEVPEEIVYLIQPLEHIRIPPGRAAKCWSGEGRWNTLLSLPPPATRPLISIRKWMDGSYEAAKSGIFTSSSLPRLSCKLKVSMVKQ